jgi:hypothetical protein
VRNLVGVLFVDAIERQPGEARRLSFVETGIRHETSRQEHADEKEPHHLPSNHPVTSL